MSVGTTYGKFFLMKKLATGGMGEIFLARQQGPAGFEKVVVIKRILNHLIDNPEYKESFLQEARLQAKMSHSNIVQIFDLNEVEEDGSFYLAMEYVHGKSLYELLNRLRQRKETMPPVLAATIVERAADGLSYAHNLSDSAGKCLSIVHRDISPHNVLISYQGEVKLIDFGIAKSEMNSIKTEAGTIKGKFSYMSPEQSRARPIDKRSDIFSLGILLYEALTGENPFFFANAVQALEAIQYTTPPPLSQVRPELAPFDAIAAKALAKAANDRYADASDLRDALTLARAALPQPPEKLGPLLQRLFKDNLDQENRALVDTNSSSLHNMGTSRGAKAGTPKTPIKTEQPVEVRDSAISAIPERILTDVAEVQNQATVLNAQAPKVEAPATAITPPPKQPVAPKKNGEELPTLVRGELKLPAPDDGFAEDVAAFKSNRGLIIVVASLAVLAVFAGAIFLAARSGSSGDGDAEKIQPPPPKKPPVVATPEPAKKDDEALKAEQAKKAEEARKAEEAKKVEEARQAAEDAKKSEQAKKDEAKKAADDAKKAAEEAKKAEAARKAEEAKKAADAKKAEDARKAEESKKAADAKKAEDAKNPKVASAGASLGVLTVRLGGASLKHNGRPVAGERVTLGAANGTVDILADGLALKLRIAYHAEVFELQSDPWAIAYVNGVSRGKTPVALPLDNQAQRVELKRPGMDQPVQLMMRFEKP